MFPSRPGENRTQTRAKLSAGTSPKEGTAEKGGNSASGVGEEGGREGERGGGRVSGREEERREEDRGK